MPVHGRRDDLRGRRPLPALTDRQVGALSPPRGLARGRRAPLPPRRMLRVGDRRSRAGRRRRSGGHLASDARRADVPLRGKPALHVSGRATPGAAAGPDREVVGVLVREQRSLRESKWRRRRSARAVSLDAPGRRTAPRWKVSAQDRDAALLRCAGLGARDPRRRDGEFVSLLDPPDRWRQGRRLPQRRHLAGAGRRGGQRERCSRRRSSSTTIRRWRPRARRLLRRHRDRRDADAADPDADRRGERRDGRRGRAGRRPCWRGPRRRPASKCSGSTGRSAACGRRAGGRA